MTGVFTANDAAELAVVTRSGLIESRHYGAAAVTSPTGETIFALGDVEAPVYPRSSLKPFQALASLRTGVVLNKKQIALACASHTGSTAHQQVALDMLSGAGLAETDLQCPVAWPRDGATRREWVLSSRPQNRLAFNCSGKHAAFLAAAKHAGYPTQTYLDQDHPIQQEVVKVLTEYASVAPSHVATDGCGAPAPTLPLRNLALAVGRLASGHEPLAEQITSAMLKHPDMVEGPGGDNTVVIEELGIVAKLGAEGVLILGTAEGYAVAVKTLDGAHRANTLVGLTLLAAAGGIDASKLPNILSKVLEPITGAGSIVGAIEIGADIKRVIEQQ